MKITPADIVLMNSEQIAEFIAAGLALVPAAQAQRLGGEE